MAILERWPEEDIQLLVDGLNRGIRAPQLRRLLKRSHSSVQGQIYRLRGKGLLPPPTKGSRDMSVRTKPTVKAKQTYEPRPARVKSKPIFIKEVYSEIYGLFDTYTIAEGQCKFPVPLTQRPNEKMLMCGKPVWRKKGAWCREHALRVWAPTRTRQ